MQPKLLRIAQWFLFWIAFYNAIFWYGADGEHPLDRSWAVVAWSIAVAIFILTTWTKYVRRSETIVILCLLVQVLLLAAHKDLLPFAFHFVAFATSVLFGMFLYSLVIPDRYARLGTSLATGVVFLLGAGWLSTAAILLVDSHTDRMRLSDTWFRMSHGFRLSPLYFFSGMGSAMATRSGMVEKKNEGYFINGKGPFEALYGSPSPGFDALLATAYQHEYCIDGNGNPYFMQAYHQVGDPRYHIHQVSTCRRDNEPIIVLDGTTYKLVKMDGTELRTLLYEEIDFGAHNGRFYERRLPARRNGKWGLIDQSGNELIPFVSESRLNEEAGSNFYIRSAGGMVGLVAPFRGEILPAVYKKISLSPFQSRREIGAGGAKEYYEGIFAVQNVQGQWGYYAANQTSWIIPIGSLTLPERALSPPPLDSDQFNLHAGTWNFKGKPITKYQLFKYDQEKRTYELSN